MASKRKTLIAFPIIGLSIFALVLLLTLRDERILLEWKLEEGQLLRYREEYRVQSGSSCRYTTRRWVLGVKAVDSEKRSTLVRAEEFSKDFADGQFEGEFERGKLDPLDLVKEDGSSSDPQVALKQYSMTRTGSTRQIITPADQERAKSILAEGGAAAESYARALERMKTLELGELVLSGRKVNPGDSWTMTYKDEAIPGVKYVYTRQYTFVRVIDDIAKISLNVTRSEPSSDSPGILTSSWNLQGVAEFRIDKGVLLSLWLEETLSMKGPGGEVTTTTELTRELVETVDR